jgi:hypothetical protein
MIKAIILFTKVAIVTLVALLFTSCKYAVNFGDGIEGNGNITTQTRTVTEDFKKIEVDYGIEVVVEQSETKSVVVKADENLQQHITTKVENGVLKVSSDHGYNSTETPIVTVQMPIINGLEATAGSKITSKNTIVTALIAVKSSSGSEINLLVEADDISLESTSGSSIDVRGKALKLDTSSSSGSDIDAQKLMANQVDSQATSGSSTDVSPIVAMKAKASSGASIDYHKTPKTITKEETSGGSVSEE